MAGREATYLIDALELPDLEPLGQLLSSAKTTKLIHYASFERKVLGRHGFALDACWIRATCRVGSAAPPEATAFAKSARVSSAWNSIRGNRPGIGPGDLSPRAR